MSAIITANAEYHFGLDEAAYCFCWLIVKRHAEAPATENLPAGYGEPEGYTSLDIPLTIDGVVYQSVAGVLPSSLPGSIGLEPDTMEATLLFPEAMQLQRWQVEARLYDGALAWLFAIPWEAYLEALEEAGATEEELDLAEWIIPLLAGTLGPADLTDEQATFELLPNSAMMDTAVGRTTGEYCDCKRYGRARCLGKLQDGINIKLHGRTVAGTIVEAPEGETNYGTKLWLQLASSRPDQWATWGILRITSGELAGVEVPVKRWLASGECMLRLPLPIVPDVGTTIELEEGCDRTITMCRTKEPDPENPTGQGNVINFQGFEPPGEALLAQQNDA